MELCQSGGPAWHERGPWMDGKFSPAGAASPDWVAIPYKGCGTQLVEWFVGRGAWALDTSFNNSVMSDCGCNGVTSRRREATRS